MAECDPVHSGYFKRLKIDAFSSSLSGQLAKDYTAFGLKVHISCARGVGTQSAVRSAGVRKKLVRLTSGSPDNTNRQVLIFS